MKYRHFIFLIFILIFICIFISACTDTDKNLLPTEDIFLEINDAETPKNEITANKNTFSNQINIAYPTKLSEMVYPEWINLSENFETDYKIYSPIDHDYNRKKSEEDGIDNFTWEFADIWRQELDYQYNKCIKNMPEEYQERFIIQQSAWEDYFYNDVFPEIAIKIDENGILLGYGYEREATLIWLDRIRNRTLEIMRIQRFIKNINTVEFYYQTQEKIISEQEAVELVINLFFNENDFEASEDGNGLLKKFKKKDCYLGYIDYIHNELENYYLFQYYEIIIDETEVIPETEATNDTADAEYMPMYANHSVTYNWYKVDIETEEVIPMYIKDERGRTRLNENYEQITTEENE
jgi:hypothetical protein